MRQMFTLDEVKHAVNGERVSKTIDRVNETSVIISGCLRIQERLSRVIFFGIRGDSFNGCEYAAKAL